MMQASMELRVQMLGTFRLSDAEGKKLSEDEIRSPMLVKLMAYIFSHHQENIASQELIDALWPNESSGNPIGALRNLIHRMRRLMRSVWGDMADEFLITGEGFYCWNHKIGLDIDAEQFEMSCREAELQQSDEKKIECYQRALDLYRGEFMKGYNESYWVTSLAVLYHSRYLNTMKEFLTLLESTGKYVEMEKIAGAVLGKEMLDEELHVFLIRSLMEQGKQKLALEQYLKSSRILYENLGISHLDSMHSVYECLIQQNTVVQTDIAVVKKELQKNSKKEPVLCDYEAFRKVYQLKKNGMERLGISVFLLLISVGIEEEGTEEEDKRLDMVMELFEKVLLQSLYSGDVASRYSRSQYVILLSECEYDAVEKMKHRIEKVCRKTFKNTVKVKVQYSADKIA